MKNILYIFAACLTFSMLFVQCTTEDLEPSLDQVKEAEGGVTTDADMFGLIKGALNRMTGSGYYGRNFIINDEVRTDNCFPNGSSGRFQTQAFFDYNAGSDPGCWDDAYRVLAVTNILTNLDLSGISGDAGNALHIQGQAHFLRAQCYFDLLRNYGQQHTGGDLGVSLVTEFKADDLNEPRATIDATKSFIYDELAAAFDKMDDAYAISPEYPTKMAAKALESRVALYFEEWGRVKSAAEAVINSNQYSIIAAGDYVNSFAVDNAGNSIFELAFSDTDNAGINGLGYIYRGDNYGDIQVADGIEAIYEDGDVRADILGYEGDKLRNMGKYPELNGYDNVSVIRYEEVILNYAEALLMDGGDPVPTLNMLTAMRGASDYSGTVTRDDILDERRKELIFEGFRFFDLVRTGQSLPQKNGPTVVGMIDPGDHRLAFAIPEAELDANSQMVQNSGY